MVVVWSGLGFLVIPLVILGAVLGGAINQDLPNVRWLRMVAVFGTALATVGLGLLLNRKQVIGRDAWGNAVTGNEGHSLYWIPVQYWSVIILVIGTITARPTRINLLDFPGNSQNAPCFATCLLVPLSRKRLKNRRN